MSSLATASGPAEPRPDRVAIGTRPRLEITGDAILGLVIAGSLAALTFLTTGGSDLAPNTWVQIALTAIAGVLAGLVVVRGARARAWGGVTLLLFLALAGLTFASIAWSVQPATSWLEGNRTLSYLAVFAAAMAAARLAPGRWRALVGAIGVGAVVVAGYALLVKVFPVSLDPHDFLARLRAPFGYWNATGLIAAMGLPACVWAGARRDGGRVLRALTIPAIAVLVAVLVLSYSRGALIAAVVGLGFWFAITPLRLRGVFVLAVGVAGAAVPMAWALSTPGIAADYQTLHAESVAGHQFGVLLLIVLPVLVLVGALASRAMERIVVPARVTRAVGVALLGAVALIPVAGVVALATSTRGFTGEISHAWSKLTNPNVVVHENFSRLGQLGSSRARYWNQGVTVGEHAPLAGVGARGFGTATTRYSSPGPTPVADAHSYVIQTFADFGVIGLALNLALLVAWAIAARRGLLLPSVRAREGAASPDLIDEHAGMAALFATVLVFGVSSLIDWTWFIPGVTVPAMLCAGWLAGRGPLSAPVGRAERRRSPIDSPALGAGLVAVAAVTLGAVWFIWQPLRSADADSSAVSALVAGQGGKALADARTAVAADPVSADALSDLSAVYAGLGNLSAARAELVKGTSIQPANQATWLALAQFDLGHGRASAAVRELRAALRLDPSSTQTKAAISQAAGQAARHS